MFDVEILFIIDYERGDLGYGSRFWMFGYLAILCMGI